MSTSVDPRLHVTDAAAGYTHVVHPPTEYSNKEYPRVETTNGEGLPDLRELAAVSAALEKKPATSAIAWAAGRFDSGLVLASSFQDCVLIGLAVQVEARHRGGLPRHAVPLPRDARVRRDGAQALRPEPEDHDADDRPRRPLDRRPRRLLRCAQGRADGACARRQARLDDRLCGATRRRHAKVRRS